MSHYIRTATADYPDEALADSAALADWYAAADEEADDRAMAMHRADDEAWDAHCQWECDHEDAEMIGGEDA